MFRKRSSPPPFHQTLYLRRHIIRFGNYACVYNFGDCTSKIVKIQGADVGLMGMVIYVDLFVLSTLKIEIVINKFQTRA